jgi:hypothetical protein
MSRKKPVWTQGGHSAKKAESNKQNCALLGKVEMSTGKSVIYCQVP